MRRAAGLGLVLLMLGGSGVHSFLVVAKHLEMTNKIHELIPKNGTP